MFRTACRAVAVVLTAAVLLSLSAANLLAQGEKYTAKQVQLDPPAELKAPFVELLSSAAVQFLDDAGKPLCDLWLRQQLPTKATPEQIKNGPTYQEVLKVSDLVGAIRFHQQWTDYRQQNVRPGVYTLRFGLQPMDGDHLGSADYNEFLLLISAERDETPEPMGEKELFERSRKSILSGHPAVLMLFPNPGPADEPKVVPEDNDHWVLQFRVPLAGAVEKTDLGFGLTLVGHGRE